MNLIILSFIFLIVFGSLLVFSEDYVNTAISTDLSPSWFTIANPPIINSNSFTNNSSINDNYTINYINGWNHKLIFYTYDSNSCSFINNNSISNISVVNNQVLVNFNFINVVNWIGYNFSSGSNNSNSTNNGYISNILNLNNQSVGNFYNYSLYSPFSNPVLINNNEINNIVNVANSNGISNIYNFALSSYESQNTNQYINNGIINNSININNSNITQGIFNYSLNSYSSTNSLNISFENNGILNTNFVSFNSNFNVIRNHSMVAFHTNLNNNVNILNTGNINSYLSLANVNANFLSNDGLIVQNSLNANITNTGNILVNTLFDSSFTGVVDSCSGIFISNIGSGNISNYGMISVIGSTQNNFSSAGINIFQSGFNNPINIDTPNRMFLDQNVRNIIINQSSANLLNFGFYINGDPTASTYLRPILVYNFSTLNLNNANLHLYIGNDIYLNKPYYIIEKDNTSTVNGQFNPNFINHTPINPNISISWFNNFLNENAAIIFSYNLNNPNSFSLGNIIKKNQVLYFTNFTDYLRDNIISYNEQLNYNTQKISFRIFNYFEKIHSKESESDILSRNILLNYKVNDNSNLGVIISNSNNNISLGFNNLIKNKVNSLGYGVYYLLDNQKSYLYFNYIFANQVNKYKGYGGINLNLYEESSFNSFIQNVKLEYGLKNINKNSKNNLYLGINYYNIKETNFNIKSENLLWDREINLPNNNLKTLYIGFDYFDKDLNNNKLLDDKLFRYYFSFKLSYIIDGFNLISNEKLQGTIYESSSKLSRLSFKTAFYFALNNYTYINFNSEFNKNYTKYMISFGIKF